MHILLTGASGYIGSHLLDAALADGHRVTVLGSLTVRQRDAPGVRAVPWRLGDAVPAAALSADSIDAVIHLAHDWNAPEGASEVNRAGTVLLRDAARQAGIARFVYVSSL